MVAGGGKAKGADYERQICQKLSLWVSNLTREDVYWRAAMSGGRAKLASRKKKDFEAQAGDISAIHSCGVPLLELFVLECKFYNDLGFKQWIFGKKAAVFIEWEKLLLDCKIGSKNRQPLMFARQNRQPDIVLTSAKGLELLGVGHKGPIIPQFAFPKDDVYGFSQRKFFTDINPSLVTAHLEHYQHRTFVKRPVIFDETE